MTVCTFFSMERRKINRLFSMYRFLHYAYSADAPYASVGMTATCNVIARSEATKQSRKTKTPDCFAGSE